MHIRKEKEKNKGGKEPGEKIKQQESQPAVLRKAAHISLIKMQHSFISVATHAAASKQQQPEQ